MRYQRAAWLPLGIGLLFLTIRGVAAPVRDLASTLIPIRNQNNVPALAGAVIRSNQVVALGAVGVRVWQTKNTVTTNDVWHLSSLTKPMTATLAARLVEKGRIAWTNTIGQSFPEATVHPKFKDVTLEQLLAHRGGVHGQEELQAVGLWEKVRAQTGTVAEQRLFWVTNVLALGPVVRPGSKSLYSNTGYVIAALMLERVTGKPWEQLMREEVFEPLGMTTAGFGVPDASGTTNQPWGHRRMFMTMPVAPGPKADNPPAFGPAGTVYCSIGDLANFVAAHLARETSDTPFLKKESFAKLHAAFDGGELAMGWNIVKRDWGGKGIILTHSGSNTTFFAVVWIAPARDFAVVAATNLGSEDGFKACDQLVGSMVTEYLK
ncbi:MAG TPA: serine hydrolase domain-containing protein [Candidatus Limnocylindria bacterium]|jgi:CubicO group peptidase (beta-lactamase class C family)|nr:serine hydrolase domain-containing protein [Candidatus Limnocylindria bacterium]